MALNPFSEEQALVTSIDKSGIKEYSNIQIQLE
jgi:hypothetical protein